MRSSLSKQVILYKDHKLTKSLPLHHFLYFHRNITMSLIYNPLWLYWGPSERSLFLCYHFTFIKKKGKLNVPPKGKGECPPKRESWMSPPKGKVECPLTSIWSFTLQNIWLKPQLAPRTEDHLPIQLVYVNRFLSFGLAGPYKFLINSKSRSSPIPNNKIPESMIIVIDKEGISHVDQLCCSST